MNRFANTFLFAGLWLISLFLVGYLARRPSPDPTPKSLPEKSANQGSSGDGLETAPLREARQRLLDLETQNEELRREKERLVAQLAQRRAAETASKKRIERRLNYWLDRAVYSKGRGNDMFLGNIEENMMFVIELAKSGDEGTRLLLDFADEPERWKEALGFLMLLPSPAGLKAITSNPWGEEGQPYPWEWDHVKWHIEELPTADVEPFLDTFGERLRARSEVEQLTDDEVYMCAQLALRHQHGPSRELFEDAWGRLEAGDKSDLIESLTFVETGASLDFLESVAETDGAPSVREAAQAAADVLAEFVAAEQ